MAWHTLRVQRFVGAAQRSTLTLAFAPTPSRIFTVLGHPSAAPGGWHDLDSLRHWRDNTENVRMRRPEHGSLTLAQLLWKTSPLMRCAMGTWGVSCLYGCDGKAVCAGW